MSRRTAVGGVATAALAIGACAGLAACGEDDPATTSTGAAGLTNEVETTTSTAETTTTTATEDETGSGGIEPPVTPDEGHEGGGPDPGTGEGSSGGVGGSGGGTDGQGGGEPGGQSPPDAFEQFCEENPRACE